MRSNADTADLRSSFNLKVGKTRLNVFAEKRLQFPVGVDKSSPVFARASQQAIGGVEGEIRVMMQYLSQACGARGPMKSRDMLLNTGTEETGHIEMLSTAAALNPENAPLSFQQEAAANPIAGAILGGMNLRHIPSTELAALPENSNSVPFNAGHVYASGNLAADMHANVAAESTGRVLACRLHAMTDDPGRKEMLAFPIARDTMHQQQWLAVIEYLGGVETQVPMPNTFPQKKQDKRFSYAYFVHDRSQIVPEGCWTQGRSIDSKGEFTAMMSQPWNEVPTLVPARPNGLAQRGQMFSDLQQAAQMSAGQEQTGLPTGPAGVL